MASSKSIRVGIKYCSRRNPKPCGVEINPNDPHNRCLRHNSTCFPNHQYDPSACEPCLFLIKGYKDHNKLAMGMFAERISSMQKSFRRAGKSKKLPPEAQKRHDLTQGRDIWAPSSKHLDPRPRLVDPSSLPQTFQAVTKEPPCPIPECPPSPALAPPNTPPPKLPIEPIPNSLPSAPSDTADFPLCSELSTSDRESRSRSRRRHYASSSTSSCSSASSSRPRKRRRSHKPSVTQALKKITSKIESLNQSVEPLNQNLESLVWQEHFKILDRVVSKGGYIHFGLESNGSHSLTITS